MLLISQNLNAHLLYVYICATEEKGAGQTATLQNCSSNFVQLYKETYLQKKQLCLNKRDETSETRDQLTNWLKETHITVTQPTISNTQRPTNPNSKHHFWSRYQSHKELFPLRGSPKIKFFVSNTVSFSCSTTLIEVQARVFEAFWMPGTILIPSKFLHSLFSFYIQLLNSSIVFLCHSCFSSNRWLASSLFL